VFPRATGRAEELKADFCRVTGRTEGWFIELQEDLKPARDKTGGCFQQL
jgi:hypothetical protein